MLRLNSISRNVFDATDAVENKQKITYRVNGVEKTKELSRKDIVATGRLVACEHFGSIVNHRPNQIEKYNSRLPEGIDYATLSKAHTEKKLLFCAAQVSKMTGEEVPSSFEEFKKNNAKYAQDKDFLKVLAAIDRDVLQPIYFDVINDVGMDLMRWEAIPFGGTKEITVGSNDVFMLEDSAWGSGKSTTKNYLYSKTITLNPSMYSCNATIKWYQDIVAGDAGRYYAALLNGMYSKIYARLIQTMKAAVAGGQYIPSGLTYPTYSSANWIALTDKVAAVNGVRFDDLLAIGTRSALSNVLPVDGNGGAIIGLQYGLGAEWFRNGFLPNVSGVSLFPVSPVVVPGTQNSTIDTIDTGNDIYIMARAGRGYAPIMGGYYEGTPITLTATPGGTGNAQGTADFTIDINFGATMDFKPVFASKVGVMTSVYSA